MPDRPYLFLELTNSICSTCLRKVEAKVLIERWRVQYNTVRPHSSLGYRPPAPDAVWVGMKDGEVPPTVEGFSPPEDTAARKPMSSDGKKLVRLT